MDISKLPKPALFNLILQVKPEEIKYVCKSNNPRVREICRSKLFQEAYKKKHPKKLMGKIVDVYKDGIKIIYEDAMGNTIENYNNGEMFIYTPFKQIYPSTYRKNFTETELRMNNPITLFKYNDENLYVGRDQMHEIFTTEDEEKFLESYNKEVKEFLEYIERESWWNPDIQFGDNQLSEKIKKEFMTEVEKIIGDYISEN